MEKAKNDMLSDYLSGTTVTGICLEKSLGFYFPGLVEQVYSQKGRVWKGGKSKVLFLSTAFFVLFFHYLLG